MSDQPIGIFDSGVGGLTIYEEIHQLLPNENIIYLADSKNAPYGEKSKQEIVDISVKNTEFLLSKGAKLIVVACNTASTNAVKHLRNTYDVPFIRVQPAIKPAAERTRSNTVGILATKGTLESELLFETSQRFASGVRVISKVGEGLVSGIERGEIDDPRLYELLRSYLEPMVAEGIDHLVLGCTHYPLLRSKIEEIVGKEVSVIDSGEAIARQTKVILTQENLLNHSNSDPVRYFYTNKNRAVLQSILDLLPDNLSAEKIDF